jgi:ubiquinone/menaquinone biosynthesis C-methylase UbiE
MSDNIYIHGTEGKEQERLAILNNLTNKSFLDFVKLRKDDRVLEVGSGLGLLAKELALRIPDGKVTGLEKSQKQLRLCPSSISNLTFIKGDAHNMPFKNNSFDVVYCRYILEHVANPLKVLNEVRRVLIKGGRLYVQENNILAIEMYPECPHFKKAWQKFALLQYELGGDALIGKKLYSLLKKCDFKKIELSAAPEFHYYDSVTFVPWIENLIANIEGARKKLIEYKLLTEEEIKTAINELQNFITLDDASTYFYWNRASALR